jgi:hypothetical protein
MLEFLCLCIKLKLIIKTNLASNSNLSFEIMGAKELKEWNNNNNNNNNNK